MGVAIVVLLSRLGAAVQTTRAGLELKAIGAVVIGGVPITGVTGNALSAFLGVLLMGVISNMLKSAPAGNTELPSKKLDNSMRCAKIK